MRCATLSSVNNRLLAGPSRATCSSRLSLERSLAIVAYRHKLRRQDQTQRPHMAQDKLTRKQIDELNWLERFFYTRLRVPPERLKLVWTVGIVSIVVLSLGLYKVGELIRVAMGGKSDAEQLVRSWEASAPKPVDVDGDGDEDIVGLYAAGDGIFLGAFESASGNLLWRSGPVTSIQRPVDGSLTVFGVRGEHVALVKLLGNIEIYSLRDGKRVGGDWPVKASRMCAPIPPEEGIRAHGNGGLRVALDLKARTSSKIEGRPPCSRPNATAYLVDGKPYGPKVNWALRDGDDVLAMSIHSRPTLRGHDVAGKERWSRPMHFTELDARNQQGLDLAGGRAFLGLHSSASKDSLVEAVDARTGKTLWIEPMGSPNTIVNLTASPSYVYVVIDKALVVLDAKTGKQKGVLGGN